MTEKCVVVCSRCKKGYTCGQSCEKSNANESHKCTNQGMGCSANIYMQTDLGKHYYGGLDKPPTNEAVKFGQIYIQCYDPSLYDGNYFAFCCADTEQTMQKNSWIDMKVSCNVCDVCIADMLRKKEIFLVHSCEKVSVIYPRYCDICDKLYDNDGEQTQFIDGFSYTSKGSGCNICVCKLPQGKWTFCDTRFVVQHDYPFYFFPKLDQNLKCLKPYGAVCNSCFNQFSIYGAPQLLPESYSID